MQQEIPGDDALRVYAYDMLGSIASSRSASP